MATSNSITPNPANVNEDAGSSFYGDLLAETLFVSTTTNHGSSNNIYCGGLLNQTLAFSGQTFRTVSIPTTDHTVVENNETFGFIVQRNSNDTELRHFSHTPLSPGSTTVNESGGTVTFTVARSGGLPAETLFVNTSPGEGFSNSNDYTGKLNEQLAFALGQTSKTVTVSITNDSLAESNATLGLLVPTSTYLANSAFAIVDNDEGSTANSLFAQEGKLAFLATLANAAYRLRTDRDLADGVNTTEVVGDNINNATTAAATADFTLADRYLELLNRGDMSSLTPAASGNASFPSNGLEGGIFTRGNAAALVARSADALFVAFRGTNDFDGFFDLLFGTPDRDHWSTAGKAAHYALFADLRTAINAYLIANASVTKVYVTGHSLGGAMAHAFMQEQAGDARYEAVTFGSLGFGTGTDFNDPRIANILNTNDIVQLYDDRTDGDDNVLINGIADQVTSHSMDLYLAIARFMRAEGIDLNEIRSLSGIDYDSFVMRLTQAGTAFNVGVGANSLNGTGSHDLILGGAGNDALNGLAGIDYLNGGMNNDTYVMDVAGDRISETAAGGTDLVRSSTISLNLANYINVEHAQLLGAAAGLSLTGNNNANTLYGETNSVANRLTGLGGNDTYVVGLGDTVIETATGGTDRLVSSSISLNLGQLAFTNVENASLSGNTALNLTGTSLANTLVGNTGANIITGLGGNDLLYGGAGNDRLTGGLNNDSFVFHALLNASTNMDTVTDFSVPEDTIRLENAIFTALVTPGALAAGAFNFGFVPTQADDRIVYNSATGALIYDSNGLATGGAVQFATLAKNLALTNADFVVI